MTNEHKVEASRGTSGGLPNLARGSSMPTMLAPSHASVVSHAAEAGEQTDSPRKKDSPPRALFRTQSEASGMLQGERRGRSCLRVAGSLCDPSLLPEQPPVRSSARWEA